MFRRILMPLDGSRLAECAVSCTTALARTFRTPVTLLRVLEKSQAADCSPPIDPLDWHMCKTEAGAYLADLASRFEAEGVETESILKEGQPAQRILEAIEDKEIDLLVVSSHGRSGLNPWYAGSVFQKIAARARISIMIVRAYQESAEASKGTRFDRILVPLDGSKRSEFALPPAVRLARDHASDLILTHVTCIPEMPRRHPPSPEDRELSARLVQRNQEEMETHFESVLSRLPVKARIFLEPADDATLRLHELVGEQKADLVVMSAHGYSGKSKWTYGSVAHNFITYGTTPLLLMQDFPRDRIEPTKAESASAERKGH